MPGTFARKRSWRRNVLSARFAFFEKSSSSPPHQSTLVDPARAAHSHSSPVGRRTFAPVFFASAAQNAAASSRDTRTTGWSGSLSA